VAEEVVALDARVEIRLASRLCDRNLFSKSVTGERLSSGQRRRTPRRLSTENRSALPAIASTPSSVRWTVTVLK
jgi:hypothetical protein